jgi:uncharacterized protein (DUF433 family)
MCSWQLRLKGSALTHQPVRLCLHATIFPMGVIVKDPHILGGIPVFRGTRVPIQTLFDYLEGGERLEDFLRGFPTVSREAAITALEEAKDLLLTRP